MLVCLVAIVGLRVNPFLLQLPFIDRTALAEEKRMYPDRRWPLYPRFLDRVRETTKDGDAIALMFPIMNWNGGYSDAYYRASYFLAGREVLPLLTWDERFHPENLHQARYIAAWAVNVQPRDTSVVWRAEGGQLLRH